MLGRRECGVLLHLTSLPSPFGIGDLGPWACRFVDFLAAARQRYWQILPLNPTDPTHNDTPYSSISAFACNPLLISPESLVQDRFLLPADLENIPDFPAGRVDFPAVHLLKDKLLARAYERFRKEENRQKFLAFCQEESFWLDDFALFRTLKHSRKGEIWSDWPAPLRDRHPGALQAVEKDFAEAIEREKFYQYLFFNQWQGLRRYANEKGIQIIGDVPIYIDYDSADVWVHPDLFKLNDRKKAEVVAGVPPDYFSKTGQRWGNPIYRWEAMKESGYAWWLKRMDQNLRLFDWVRIDHFRGLVAFWEIPAEKETAVDGRWVPAPAMDFLLRLVERFPRLPVIAEDLGIITPDVLEVMTHFGFPGMKVLALCLWTGSSDKPLHPPQPSPELRRLHRHARQQYHPRLVSRRDIPRGPKPNLPLLGKGSRPGGASPRVHPAPDAVGGRHGCPPDAGPSGTGRGGPDEPTGHPQGKLGVAFATGDADFGSL